MAQCTHISVINTVIIGCRSAHPAPNTPAHVDHDGTAFSELLVPVSIPADSAPGLKLGKDGSATTVHHEVGSAIWLRDAPHIVEERQYSDDDILVIVAATVAECQGLGPPAQFMSVQRMCSGACCLAPAPGSAQQVPPSLRPWLCSAQACAVPAQHR